MDENDPAADDAAFDDEMRAMMSAHDRDAAPAGQPAGEVGARRPRAPSGGRYTWLPVAGAGIGVAVLVIITLLLGDSGGGGSAQNGTAVASNGALVCPPIYEHANRTVAKPWVPVSPLDLSHSHRLAPTLSPRHVTVCRYRDGTPVTPQARLDLTGHRELSGDLDPVAATLSRQPHRIKGQPSRCPAAGRHTGGDEYLIGLAYAEGTVWVSAPQLACQGASNGDATSTANLESFAAAAYRTGSWDPTAFGARAGAGPCVPRGQGRYGQESTMVPAGAVSLVLCRGVSDGSGHAIESDTVDSATVTAKQATTLIKQLNSLPTRTSRGPCRPATGSTLYSVIVRYPNVPDVAITVSTGCSAPVGNGSLQATRAGAVVVGIERLLSTR